MNLGKNVKHLRALSGVALEPMAEAMGLERAAGRQKIYALEKRESKKSEITAKLAEYFGLPVSDLLSEDLTTLTPEQYETRRRLFLSYATRDHGSSLDDFIAKLSTSLNATSGPECDADRAMRPEGARSLSGKQPSESVMLLLRAAVEAEQAGVSPSVFESLTKHLVTLRDAQKANVTANREIEAPADEAKSPSDREVEDTLRDLGIGREREASGNERTGTHEGKRKGR